MEDLSQDLKSAALDARLNLTNQEECELLAQIKRFLETVTVLKEKYDNSAEAPLFFPHEIAGRMREDKPEDSLPREVALANGYDTDKTCFRIPRIVSEE